jgi:hypothetical protein
MGNLQWKWFLKLPPEAVVNPRTGAPIYKSSVEILKIQNPNQSPF